MSRFLRLSIYLITASVPLSSQAQDLSRIGQEQALHVSGGVSASSIWYTSNGAERRDPFSYFLSGNINFSLYGWNVPFSFSYTNKNFSYVQPFNQYSLHPTYKWVTAHLGWTSMTFSPYTLSGHQFLGAGVELAPEGGFKYSAMYGQLQRAVRPDTLNPNNQPAYQRMGYGFKVAYDHKNYDLSVNLFRAKDDITSLPVVPEAQNVLPQENIAIGFTGGVTVYKGLKLTAEYAISTLTRDIRAGKDSAGGKGDFITDPFIQRRGSTATYHAFKAGMNYSVRAFSLGVGYERVDPEYQSLGAYYFNNDFQNVTVNFSQALFKNKVVLGGNAGVQQDDLAHKKMSNMKRFVGSLNLSYTASEKLQMDASYSNFQSYTYIKPQFQDITQLTPYDNLDTLNYTQISQNANYNINYQLGNNKARRQSLNMNLSFQHASDKQGDKGASAGNTEFYNVNAGYNLMLVPVQTNFTAAWNLSYNTLPGNNSLAWGPTLAVGKPFFHKQLKTRFSATYNTSSNNGQRLVDIYNLRASGSYIFLKKHNINLSLVTLFRNNLQQPPNSGSPSRFNEWTGTLGYNYSF
ncbi:porin [Chitinophaga agrisoli]|uniref:Porin n=1 Tax=Chitinophaga agrisoli TaxID=2607653 RepID=A0A5B2VTB3_9BACT|nr:porin [Chitinophaga agrisoli]KAA2243043.1 porin [Chitinophaga agrisoli]